MTLDSSNKKIKEIALIVGALVGIYIGMIAYAGYQLTSIEMLAQATISHGVQKEASAAAALLLDDIADEKKILESYFIGTDGLSSTVQNIRKLSEYVGSSINVHQQAGTDLRANGQDYYSFVVSSEGSLNSMMHVLALLDHLPFKSLVVDSELTLVDEEDADEESLWRLESVLDIAVRD